MRDTFIACIAALIFWSLVKLAIGRTAMWYALRKLGATAPSAIDRESLRDEDAFIDGWRACESCKRIDPEPDHDHIMHHYSYDGSTRERERCRESA